MRLILLLWTTMSTCWCWTLTNLLMSGSKGKDLVMSRSVNMAIEDAIGVCAKQFHWEKWGCPRIAFTRIGRLPATRETAYVQALTSAAVKSTIIRNCSKGALSICDCHLLDGADWHWRGCDHLFIFADEVCKDYLDSRGRDARATVHLHNNEAGRKIVERTARQLCKCHGVSGSCVTKTCWQTATNLMTIAEHLKEQYDSSSFKVDFNKGTLKDAQEILSSTETSLIYLEDSPDYCLPNTSVGSAGLRGRHWTADDERLTQGVAMCQQCGLRTKELTQMVNVTCNCSFEWCCNVHCEYCIKESKSILCH